MRIKLILQRTTIIIIAIVIGFQVGYWTGFFTYEVEDIPERSIKYAPPTQETLEIDEEEIQQTYEFPKPTLETIEDKVKRIQRQVLEIQAGIDALKDK